MRIRIAKHSIHLPIILLAVAETLVFFGSVYAGSVIRFTDLEFNELALLVGPLWPRAVVFALMMLAGMVAMGLYHTRQRARLVGIILRITAASALGGTGTVFAFYVFPDLLLGRGAMGLAGGIAFSLVALIRITFSRLVDENVFKQRVIVYGAGKRTSSIMQLRRRTDQRGFTIIGYIEADGDDVVVPKEKTLESGQTLLELAREHQADEIVVAMDDRRRSFPVAELLDCKLSGINVLDVLAFIERETGKVKLDILNPSWMIFSEGFNRSPMVLFVERAFDIVASSILLLVTWPIMLLAALAIMIESGFGQPVLYRQTRVGFEGEHFDVLKFRSMRVDAEKDGAKWADKNDSRITWVGSFIRKVRIDELPQIFNVLRGEMSFVGPRPERPEFVAELSQRIPYYRERHCVKPGITGWAQLCYPYGSSEKDALEKLQYDLYYVKNHSPLFDLLILLQTAEVILWGQGAR